MNWLVLFLIPLFAAACHKLDRDKEENVVSKRYIHKYGYDVSKEEWERATYPGQVLMTLRNGVSVTSHYEGGKLHGLTTCTHPHSNVTESISVYDRGRLVKKTECNVRGTPFREELFLFPSHVKITYWFASGTPLSVEEYRYDELLEGEYYDKNNEVLCRVSKGQGHRITRNQHEKVILKESIEGGFPVLRETLHPHGVPHTITPLLLGKVHGEKKVFAPSGEPISLENYQNNILDGPAVYFQNGLRYLEVTYKEGVKHGIERYFVDGETIVEETQWCEGEKHGTSTVYFDGMSKVSYYYNNAHVSKERYRELVEQAENVAIMNARAKRFS